MSATAATVTSSPGSASEAAPDAGEPTSSSSSSTIIGLSSSVGASDAAGAAALQLAQTSSEVEISSSEPSVTATVNTSNSDHEHTAVEREEPHVAGVVADTIKLPNVVSDTNELNASPPPVVHVDHIDSASAPAAVDSSPVVEEHEITGQVAKQSVPSDSGVSMERSTETGDRNSSTVAADSAQASTDGATTIAQDVRDATESADSQSESTPHKNAGIVPAGAVSSESSAEEASKAVESPTAESTTSSQAASTVSIAKLKPREQLREALLQFYTKYKPQKRGVVDQIVDKYEHDQATLFDQLERLYDAVPKLYGHRRLFVGQLPTDVTDGDLRVYFSRFGKLGETGVVKRHNRSRRFGYVQFETAEASAKCLSHRNHSLRGKSITVQEAKPVGAGADMDVAEQTSKRPPSPPASAKTSREATQDSRTPTKRGRGRPEPRALKSPSPSPSKEPPQPRKFFLGGITKSTTQHDIRAYFQRFGPVADAVAMSHRSFGFVTMGDDGSARAVLATERHLINGRVIDLRKADGRPHDGKGGPSSSHGSSSSGRQHHETRGEQDVPGPRLTDSRPDDWVCPACSNINFARRKECNRCHRPRSPPRASDAGRPPRKRRVSRSRSASRERRRYSDEGHRRSDQRRRNEDPPSANHFQRNHPRNRAGAPLLPHGVGHPSFVGSDPRDHPRSTDEYRQDHSTRFGVSSHQQPPHGGPSYFSPNPPPHVYAQGRNSDSYGPSRPDPAEPSRYASRASSAAPPEPYYDDRRPAYKPRSRSRSRSRDRDPRGHTGGRGRSPPRNYRPDDPAGREPPRSRDYAHPSHGGYGFPSGESSRQLTSAPAMYEPGRPGPSAQRPPSPPPEGRYPPPSHIHGGRAPPSGRGYSPPRHDPQQRSGSDRFGESQYDHPHARGRHVTDRDDFSRPPINGPPGYRGPSPRSGSSHSVHPLGSGPLPGPHQQRDRSFGPSGGQFQSGYPSEVRPLHGNQAGTPFVGGPPPQSMFNNGSYRGPPVPFAGPMGPGGPPPPSGPRRSQPYRAPPPYFR
eukprot:INCI8192.1.p1 GENE.INCI8192.1~~INCI8192.1.p1  ORF type:complete len:1030 (-),score=88.22 INCI8192.1:174-3263(-)